MAFDGFIKFSDIDGESTDVKHLGWIEISECNMEILQTVSSTASSVGGASAERADLSDFRFSKNMDKSSPLLALACADGTVFNNVTVELCRAGSEKIKFMEFKLTNSIISFIGINANGDFPCETIHLNYGTINWCYTQQNRKGGGASGNVAAGWNRQKNCKA